MPRYSKLNEEEKKIRAKEWAKKANEKAKEKNKGRYTPMFVYNSSYAVLSDYATKNSLSLTKTMTNFTNLIN
jgi:hypothetical protein